MGSNTRAGRVIRDNVSNIELLVIYMILLGVTSIPISLIVLGIAYASGHPTQFSPSDEPRLGFHAGPTERGTLNIVYVCTSTVFACVYLSLHSDVPHPAKPDELANALKQTKAPRFVPVIVRFLTRNSTFRRVLFMLFNVFAPELVVLVALLELVSATDGKRFMRSRGQKGWSTTLAFFADMGGFELDEELAKFEVVERHGGSMDGFERDEGHAKEAAGKRDEGTILENGTHFQNGRAFLEWFDKYYHAQCGDVKVDIETLEEEINDRSKKDTVLKLLTLCQSSWLFIETMARFLEKRAVSEMEVTTCAYIFCTLITYVCWMKKPYSITSRVVLRRSHLKPRSPPPDSSHEEHTISRTGTTSDPLRPLLLSADSNASELSNELKFPLPQMIYDNARFSPFNRSYRYPDLSWLGTSTKNQSFACTHEFLCVKQLHVLPRVSLAHS